jgi:hypothetical protein
VVAGLRENSLTINNAVLDVTGTRCGVVGGFGGEFNSGSILSYGRFIKSSALK